MEVRGGVGVDFFFFLDFWNMCGFWLSIEQSDDSDQMVLLLSRCKDSAFQHQVSCLDEHRFFERFMQPLG